MNHESKRTRPAIAATIHQIISRKSLTLAAAASVSLYCGVALSQQAQQASQPASARQQGQPELLAQASTNPPAPTGQTSQEPENGLQEVVVTARYRTENLQQTPISITAITAEDLQQQQLTNVNDIGDSIPNAYFRSPPSNFGPTETIGLRGFTQTDFDYSFQPTVGFYIDDVYQGTLTGSSFDLADIQRVEVLNGPQGTLFGMNSIGGAIRLITNKPQDNDSASVSVTYGEKDRQEFVGIGNVSLIPQTLFVRVVADSRSEDSVGHYLDFTCEMKAQGQPESVYGTLPQSALQGEGCALGGLGGFNHQNVRAALRYLPTSNLEVNVNAYYSKQADEPPLQALLTPYGGPTDVFNDGYDASTVFPKFGMNYTGNPHFVSPSPWDNYASYGDIVSGQSYNPVQALHEEGTSATVDYNITNDIHFKYIWGYRTYNTTWINDSDLTPFGLTQTNYLEGHRQFQNEARLTGDSFAHKLDWTVGLFYYDARDLELNGSNFDAYGAFLPNNVTTEGYSTNNQSAFIHLQYKLTDKWSVSAGYRYTKQFLTNNYNKVSDDPMYASADLATPGPVIEKGTHGDWSGSLDYQLTPTIYLYAQAATGFTLPGFNSRVETLGQLEESVPGQEATNYEIGAKTDWFDHRLRVNGSVFYEDYKSYLNLELGAQCTAATSLNPGTPNFTPLCPAGTALAGTPGLAPWFYYTGVPAYEPGAELSVTAAPIDRLLINFEGGWLEFHSKNGDTTAPGYINPSVRLQPEWNASAGIQYAVMLPNNASITPRLDWRYQGYMTNGPEGAYQISQWRVPGYSVFNARLTYAPNEGKWSVSVQALNLFNKFYWEQLAAPVGQVNSALPPSADNLEPTAAQVGTPGLPREWMMNFTYNFE